MLFRSKILRWHTFRVILLTSIVWMLFGFGVLVYYMDHNFMVNNSQRMVNGLPNSNSRHSQPKAQPRILNTRIISVKNSHSEDAQTPLPPYSTDQLKTWSEPVIKDNPRDWPGEL